MTHQGIAAEVKTNDEVSVLHIPRTGPSPLRVTFASPNDGSAGELTATLTNDFATEFPHARIRFVLRRGSYQVEGASILQAFNSDDGTRTVLDLDVRIAGKSAVNVHARATRKGR